jgi:hypothetical protein
MTLATCNTCKHLIGVRTHLENYAKWRCGHKNNIVETKVNLITGLTEKFFLRENLHSLRYTFDDPSVCGPEGTWYEEYIEPVYTPAPTIAGKEAIELDIFGSTELQANRKAAADRLAAIKAKRNT